MESLGSVFRGAFLLADIDWWRIAQDVLAAIVVSGLLALLAGPLVKTQIGHLSASLVEITQQLKAAHARLEELSAERAACELRAAKTFATHAQVGQTLVDSAVAWQEAGDKIERLGESLRESIARVHQRVDQLVEKVSRLEAARRTGD